MNPDETAATQNRLETSEPIVRPFGYVADEPIVRRIGERELYLGNEAATDPVQHDHTFEFVLSVTTDERPLTTHHHPLDDGPGNDWPTFEAAVDTARALYRRDGSLLIHCKAGISRSSALVAITIAAEEDRRLDDAFAIVHEARPHAVSHPALHEAAVIYLAARR
ncbi:protein-tyrosine phosphatase family protein [Halococcus saccharolyticus]|uniref:Dual specificity protein phosphatase n=1 Tax=Halococcus saccharolyticus DSM 5350 TaxID=1227455 RepID=M0M9Q3_9EURY|nr:dual specificity protein phosphatase [Halococcus saccharolyticus]EMA42502.1 Dual specificity protein phosphatase [Halococcus saccharolyticus DSM 5350]